MNIQLPLKKIWFQKTQSGEKTEDYRELKPYWARRFLKFECIEDPILYRVFCDDLKNLSEFNETFKKQFDTPKEFLDYHGCEFQKFDFNVMTLGYPKASDPDRVLRYEHKGIEIRTGNTLWGAEEGKLYFVIKHGEKKALFDADAILSKALKGTTYKNCLYVPKLFQSFHYNERIILHEAIQKLFDKKLISGHRTSYNFMKHPITDQSIAFTKNNSKMEKEIESFYFHNGDYFFSEIYLLN